MPVPAFDLLKLVDPQIDPNRAKIHLAGWNGKEHPLDEYLAGRFEEWQRWQSRKNFERPAVMSLIQLGVTQLAFFRVAPYGSAA